MEAYVMPMNRRGAGSRASRRTRRGPVEREAFGEFVRRYDRQMRMLAYRLLGDAALMDDVLQEAYLKAYRAYPSFRHEASPSTWLYRITYNTCIDHLRSRGRVDAHGGVVSIDALAEEGFHPRAADDVESAVETRHELAAALDALPAESRATVLLVDALGHDYSTAAAILDVAPGTVASRLNRARAALRATLADTTEEVSR